MSEVFLNYDDLDHERVRPLEEWLEERGWSVSWDKQESVDQRLRESRAMVVVWTEASVGSEWVAGLVERFEARGGEVAHVLFDSVEPPPQFASRQRVDLVDWDGSAEKYSLKQLFDFLAATTRGYVFISYHTDDRPAAVELRDRLEGLGLAVRGDFEDLGAIADDWDAHAAEALRQATMIVVLLSVTAVEAAKSYQRAQWSKIDQRLRRTRPDVPFVIPVALDEEVFGYSASERVPGWLREIQWTTVEELLDIAVERFIELGGALPTETVEAPAVEPETEALRATLDADLETGRDAFEIEVEATAFAQVIASRDLHPPLSVGLFGDWGAGKSFFMRKLKEKLTAIRDRAREGGEAGRTYCQNIVFIDFNAWHFIDRELWASLASEVFRQLDERLEHGEVLPEGVADDDATEARLKAKRDLTLRRIEERKRERIAARRDSYEHEAAELRSRLQVELSPARLARRALRNLTADKKGLAKTLGMTPEQLDAFAVGLAETKNEWSAWKGIFAGKRWLLWVLAAGGTSIAGWLFAQAPGVEVVQSALGAVGVYGLALAGFLGRVVVASRRVRVAIDEAEAEGHITRLRRRAASAEQQVADAEKELSEIDKSLDDFKGGRRLAKFIHARRGADPYREHLGVVAKARADFEMLSELFSRSSAEAGEESWRAVAAETEPARHGTAGDRDFPNIDRIVLFIDDLDRCHEAKVFEVLQAVHLLLAFPLFVVVTAVDSRWLLHSLQQSAPILGRGMELDRAGTERYGRHSTPINYLEKIFQIPFRLRPMGRVGYEQLVWQIVRPGNDRPQGWEPRPAEATRSHGASTGPATPAGKVGQSVTEPASERGSPADERSGTGASGSAGEPPGEQPGEPREERSDVDPSAGAVAPGSREPPAPEVATPIPHAAMLDIDDADLRYLELLYPMIPSPRTAKRLVNVYRLVRVLDSHREPALRQLETAEARRAILLLLALLHGLPEGAAPFVETMLKTPSSGSCWDYIERIHSDAMETADTEDDWWAARALERFRDNREALGLDEMSATQVQDVAELALRFSIPYTPGAIEVRAPEGGG